MKLLSVSLCYFGPRRRLVKQTGWTPSTHIKRATKVNLNRHELGQRLADSKGKLARAQLAHPQNPHGCVHTPRFTAKSAVCFPHWIPAVHLAHLKILAADLRLWDITQRSLQQPAKKSRLSLACALLRTRHLSKTRLTNDSTSCSTSTVQL